MPAYQIDKSRFTALVHYICDECRNDPDVLGKVKLNKILWLADIYAYKNWGLPLTGETYKKHSYGPVSHHLDEVLVSLQKDRKLYIHDVEYYGKQKKEFISKERVDSEAFTDKEKRLIDSVIQNVCYDHTAATISEKAHDELWEIADMHEILPYEAALVMDSMPLTDEDREWAKEQIENM